MIEIEGLTTVDMNARAVLDGVTLSVRPLERVGIVGESGSGKTTLALALLGAVRPGLRRAEGRVSVGGQDLAALSGPALRAYRRGVIAYLPQDPPSTLTPTIRVAGQLREVRAGADVPAHLDRVGLPTDRAFQRRFPHQLSGGQQQRLALARVLATEPSVLVLDEPTTGLDALTRRQVLDQIAALVQDRAITLVFISHDLPAVARMADRLIVMREGRIVEDGPREATLGAPSAPYTAELVRAVPDITEAHERRLGPPEPPRTGTPILRVRDLTAGHGRRRPVVAAAGVSLEVRRGECVALLGLSGAGKTTLARSITGHHRPDGGTVELDGQALPPTLRGRTVEQRRRIQLVAQDTSLSLNPRRTVRATLTRPLRRLRGLDRDAADAEVTRLLSLVDLDDGIAGRYPGQLSGGQRQRVGIARALAAGPDVLLCDEVTASLDARVQADVLRLLADLRYRLDLALLFVSHDLGVVARLADRVLVLLDGAICEGGPVGEVLVSPQHPWTRSLVGAVASGPQTSWRTTVSGHAHK
ncbi:ABC transporter ATP-binding protein [Dactylosporangium vinaceum]|uniref:ABC transporter ATP-binding protein n=1 Tax=Dactylosporangium vinaceum TaxID=53362 RepID=A0ABV5MKR1_9ACTN|nr:ABC transporter ATP-binding protein [Dactylosporangium vinaceum]UAB93899.1 ABC transporter ATP-binding protein [Dactylosporangium vinaceum]